MKKPEFYKKITPRKEVRANIYILILQRYIVRSIRISIDLKSVFELQAAASEIKIHCITFFDVKFYFSNKNPAFPFHSIMLLGLKISMKRIRKD